MYLYTYTYIEICTHTHKINKCKHKCTLWSMIIVILQQIIHMALQPGSQSCKLKNCINTGPKDCVCPQRLAIYIQDNRYMQTKRIRELRDEKCPDERCDSSWEEWE